MFPEKAMKGKEEEANEEQGKRDNHRKRK